jgi:hypothetical protein
VAEEACNPTETAEMRMKGGRLPDLAAIERAIRDAGVGGRLRGVEATIDGQLVKEGQQLRLRIAGAGEALRLVPLTRKVQWEVKKKRPQPLTPDEKKAHAELDRRWRGQPLRVRVIGPLVQEEGARLPAVEVRRFILDP